MIQPVSTAQATTDPTTYAAGTDSGGTGATSQSSSGMNSLLAPNEFLDLLVDNLKYQDPLDPTSSADLLTQLASLSQVQTQEQIVQTEQTSAAANLIGDQVSGTGSTGQAVSGTVTGFSLTSSGPTLEVGGESLSLGEITAVNGSSQTSQSQAG